VKSITIYIKKIRGKIWCQDGKTAALRACSSSGWARPFARREWSKAQPAARDLRVKINFFNLLKKREKIFWLFTGPKAAKV